MTYTINNKKKTFISWMFGVCILLTATLILIPEYASSTTTVVPKVVEQKVIENIQKEKSLTITPHDERQLQCLARNAYFEAGNQSNKGMVAVTNVVMNRVEDGRFPKTPCDVIKQRTRRMCQFSWVCERKKQIRNMENFNRARAAAERVYLEQIHDVTNGALFYHATYVSPNWGLPRVAKIGAHIFYRG